MSYKYYDRLLKNSKSPRTIIQYYHNETKRPVTITYQWSENLIKNG